MADKKGTSQFVVDLGDLELPADAAQNLSTEIRKLVLSRIAELDFKGDLRVAASLPKELGPRTDGIWIDVIKSL